MRLLSLLVGGLALLGLPLFLVILGVTLLGQRAAGLRAPVALVEMFDKVVDNPVFLTIPLFAHAGFVLSASRAPQRLLELVRATLGWMPGGAALVAIATCALFTAFTGASGVTIIALGGLLLPMLTRDGYPERFNLGLVTTGGSLGLLFPPSLPLIIFALIASNIAPVPVDTLFLAGLLPGLLLMSALGLYGGIVQRRVGKRERVPFERARCAAALRATWLELPIPFIIVVGVFGGWVTIGQAAAMVCGYVVLVEVFLHRDLDARELAAATQRAMVLTGGILVIILAALAMTNLLTDQEVPARLLAVLEDHITSPLTFLLALNVFLLVVGCLMDVYSAILVVIPLVMPIALRFGVDPVHLGIIFLTNLEIGYSTPPVGINLFISSLRFDKSVLLLYRASLPFLGILLGCLALITYVPFLSLGLVRAVEGTGTVEVVFARRGGGDGGGTGELRWARRPVDSPLDWDALAPPPDGSSAAALDDLVLRYRPRDPDDLDLLRAGTGPVRCVVELGRAAEGGHRVTAQLEAEFAAPADLVGTTHEVDVSLVPADGHLDAIGLASENFAAASLTFDALEDGRLSGVLRAVVVWFPDDPSAAEEVHDLELRFACAPALDALTFEPPGADAAARTVSDVRLTRTVTDAGRAQLALERTRPGHHDLYASCSGDADPGAWRGRVVPLDLLRLRLDDVDPAELPPGLDVALARLVVEEADAERVAGRVEAVLQGTGETFDVEVRFDLELRERAGR